MPTPGDAGNGWRLSGNRGMSKGIWGCGNWGLGLKFGLKPFACGAPNTRFGLTAGGGGTTTTGSVYVLRLFSCTVFGGLNMGLKLAPEKVTWERKEEKREKYPLLVLKEVVSHAV